MDIKTLNEIEKEINRFMERLKAAQKRLKEDDFGSGCRENGAVKRAALDLKNELTKITR